MKSQYIQRNPRLTLLITFIVIVLLVLPVAVLAAAGDTTRVSVDSSGTQANGNSNMSSISTGGRYVTFDSDASNLVTGDTNGRLDVFVHDRINGATTRVSVDSSGTQGNGHSFSPSISSDGRYVAFQSDATNLVAGDTNEVDDVFVHDRNTGATTRVSVDSSGTQGNGGSYNPYISSDGRYVVFLSNARNLVAGDTNFVYDIFVHDRTTGATTRVSVDSSGVQGNDNAFQPSISSDGRYVLFYSKASNLVTGDTNGVFDVFVHDRTTGVTRRISVDSSGVQGNDHSSVPYISSDGRYVAFASNATNLVAGDTNGVNDVFVHDLTTGATTRVSVDSSGVQGNGGSFTPSISSDGRYVVFLSAATNLVAGDTNGVSDVFVYDMITGATKRVSVDSSGVQGNGDPSYPYISSDGGYVAFVSYASNLVTGDTNGTEDVFVHERDLTSPAVPVMPATGFAPNRVTLLPPQAVSYTALGDLWLEIPKLGVRMNILGVPQANGAWDVSWLGSNAGWLNGSAFPTWAGNSVLTGHVWNADNTAGPFRYLNTLWWGDQVIIHAGGAQYVYEVRSVQQVSPSNTAAMMKHETLPWVTLVTCRGYDAASNTYQYRVLVRAVLVEVK
jgi:LPXTG-site transpeptidase (sortase) family protein